MMRPRWSLPATALGIVVMVSATAFAAIVIAFPPDRLALLLSQEVKAATGRDFKVGGQLSTHLLPTISVHANDIVLGNVEWGSRAEMVRVRHAAFEAATSALLRGQLKILRVDIEGVDALLQSDDSGRSNWQFKPQADPPLRTSENGSPSGNQTPQIELSQLIASDVHVAYLVCKVGPPTSVMLETLDLRADGDDDNFAAILSTAQQRWKIEGRTGRGALLLDGAKDWPFNLHVSTEGATIAANGTLGTGPRAGAFAANLVVDIGTPAALSPFGTRAALIPLPIKLNAKLTFAGQTL